MSYRAAIKGKEYWRLGTSMLLFDVDNPLDVYTLVSRNRTRVSARRAYAIEYPFGTY